jgi:hypothetical protein
MPTERKRIATAVLRSLVGPGGIVGLITLLWRPAYAAIGFAGNMDFLHAHWPAVTAFVDSGWGTGAFVLAGFVIIGISIRQGLVSQQPQLPAPGPSGYVRVDELPQRKEEKPSIVGSIIVTVIILAALVGSLIPYSPGKHPDSGPISWSFDDPSSPTYFFGMVQEKGKVVYVLGFQATGKNILNEPITDFKGIVRSDITNRELMLKFVVDGFTAYPDNTYGIPPLSEFAISTVEPSTVPTDPSKEGEPENKWLSEFSRFTITLDYNGTHYVRHFIENETAAQFARFHAILDPDKSTIPRIIRRIRSN